MKLSRHPCEIKLEDTAEIKSNFKYLVWEISSFKHLSFHVKLVWEISNFKHLIFKLLVMKGFKETDKMMNFVRLIMERAVVLERIIPVQNPKPQAAKVSGG